MRGVTDSSLTPSSWRVARGVCRLEIAHVSAVFTARDGARRRRPGHAPEPVGVAGPINRYPRPFTLFRRHDLDDLDRESVRQCGSRPIPLFE